MHPVLLSGALAIVAFASTGASDAEDHAAADAAIEAFHESVEAFGFTSVGTVGEEDSIGVGEADFGFCLGGFEQYLDNTPLQVDGGTARALSDEFESSSANLEERAFAMVITVEDEAFGQLEELFDRLGSKATRDCVLGVMSTSYPDETHDITVRNDDNMLSELDGGIPAGRLGVSVEDLGDRVHIRGMSISVALVSRSLVAVALFDEGATFSDFYHEAHLQAMVDELT